MINFGELRKKLGFVTEKTSVKLNELIYSGSTQLRVRGKTWRIKTPVCKALRKLNLIEGETIDLNKHFKTICTIPYKQKTKTCKKGLSL